MSNDNSADVFKSLFTSHFKILCNFAYLYVHDIEEAKEIVQGVFLKFWENASFDNPQHVLKSFLFSSVKNACIDKLKHNMIRQQYRNRILLECTEWNEDTLEAIIYNDLSVKVESLIKTLPPQCQKIFRLSRINCLKNKEIAKELNISVKAVEAQISKAMAIMKENLTDYIPSIVVVIFFLFNIG